MNDQNEHIQLHLFNKSEYFTPDKENLHRTNTSAREITQYNFDYPAKLKILLAHYKEEVDYLSTQGYHGLDQTINNNQKIGFKQGFGIILFASLSVNPYLQVEILDKMALVNNYRANSELLRTHAALLMKSIATIESKIGLNADFISGLVTACLEVDTICRTRFDTNEPIFGFGGMGGDKGLKINGKKLKTGNISTLASIMLSSIHPVHKHHSRANTSVLGGQDAVEEMGYNSFMLDEESIKTSFKKTNLVFSSCHHLRFIHDLSHFIRGETINHIVGPLSIPHQKDQEICFVGGVNHNVHPQTVIETLIALETRSVQKYSGAVSFCGLGYEIDPEMLKSRNIPSLFDDRKYYLKPYLKNLIALDEVSPPPYPTLASFMKNDLDGLKTAKTVMIYPCDFGLREDEINLEKLKVPNNKADILEFNKNVLAGENRDGVKYVCMTVALALFAQKHCNNLDAFIENRINPDLLTRCYREAIESFNVEKINQKIQNFNN